MSGSAASIVAFAKAQVGDAYVSGGTGPNAWDCSGLVQAAYRTAGIDLPRVSQSQSTAGTQVSLDNLQPGDILYWGGAGSAYTWRSTSVAASSSARRTPAPARCSAPWTTTADRRGPRSLNHHRPRAPLFTAQSRRSPARGRRLFAVVAATSSAATISRALTPAAARWPNPASRARPPAHGPTVAPRLNAVVEKAPASVGLLGEPQDPGDQGGAGTEGEQAEQRDQGEGEHRAARRQGQRRPADGESGHARGGDGDRGRASARRRPCGRAR
ncbi:hypothetical protein SBADM41S_04375 [Streptomyces badius]